jgi:thioesterase domain-containing protein
MSYDEPIDGDFVAVCEQPALEEWRRFMTMLERRGRGRVTMAARLVYAGRAAAAFEGDFVALKD